MKLLFFSCPNIASENLGLLKKIEFCAQERNNNIIFPTCEKK